METIRASDSEKRRQLIQSILGYDGAASRRDACRTFIRNKIRTNMEEYKSGRFSSPKQALAVSYSQARANGCY